MGSSFHTFFTRIPPGVHLDFTQETDPDWRVRLFSARALSASSNVSARLAALAEAEGHGDVRRVLLGAPPGDVALGDAPTTTDGPLRVVALHGAASNSAIMKFQVG